MDALQLRLLLSDNEWEVLMNPEDLMDMDASMPSPQWADPDNPTIVDRKRFREPDGYQSFELALLYGQLQGILASLGSFIMSVIAMNDGTELEKAEAIQQQIKHSRTLSDGVQQRIDAYWDELRIQK